MLRILQLGSVVVSFISRYRSDDIVTSLSTMFVCVPNGISYQVSSHPFTDCHNESPYSIGLHRSAFCSVIGKVLIRVGSLKSPSPGFVGCSIAFQAISYG